MDFVKEHSDKNVKKKSENRQVYDSFDFVTVRWLSWSSLEALRTCQLKFSERPNVHSPAYVCAKEFTGWVVPCQFCVEFFVEIW